MKNILILFIVFASILSCSSKRNQLKGNWYSCTPEGEYLELFTKKDSFRIVTDRSIVTNWTHYRIESDTIFFKTPLDWNESSKAILNYNSGKSLTMKFININETTKLKPLNSIVENIEDEYELLISCKKRAKKAECNVGNKNN